MYCGLMYTVVVVDNCLFEISTAFKRVHCHGDTLSVDLGFLQQQKTHDPNISVAPRGGWASCVNLIS